MFGFFYRFFEHETKNTDSDSNSNEMIGAMNQETTTTEVFQLLYNFKIFVKFY